MLRIHFSRDLPGSTYFRTSDIAPTLEGTELYCYNGSGPRRYWGTPRVITQIVRNDGNLCIVVVTGWHKHTVRPVGGTFYFVNLDGTWTRKTARSYQVKMLMGVLL